MARKSEKPQAHAQVAEVTQLVQKLRDSIDPASGRKLPNVVHLPGKPARQDEQTQNTGLQPGAEAQGSALAIRCIEAAKTEGNVWNRFLAELVQLSTEARAVFVSELRKHVKAMQAYVDASGKDPIFKGAKGSAIARLSELTTCALMLNGGWVPSVDGLNAAGLPNLVDPFYTNVAEAKTFKAATADAGGGEKRGRKRNEFVVQVVKYLNRFEVIEGEDTQRETIMAYLKGEFPKQYKIATTAE